MGIPVFPSLLGARRVSSDRKGLTERQHAPVLSIDVKVALVEHFEEHILIIGPRGGKEPLIWPGH